jgi:hypothetical protein
MKYSYNGVELPALPEWDKETYPYACIVYDDGVTRLIVSNIAPLYWRRDDNSEGITAPTIGTKAQYYEAMGELWEHKGNFPLLYNGLDSCSWVWANTDILDKESGNVYLAASEPVPVTDHNALTQGWIVGKRLAAQRGKA